MYNAFDFISFQKKSTIQNRSHVNAFGSKFDLDVKEIKVNLGSPFEPTCCLNDSKKSPFEV